MTWVYSRFTGFILLIGAILGIVLSLAGLAFVWSYQATVTREITTTLVTLDQTMVASTETLTVLNSSLDQAATNIDTIDNSIVDVAATINTTSGVASSLGTMLGQNFVQVIHDTQSSLTSVESSAKLIDDTLRIISAVPIIGARYRPDVPLQTSIAKVSESLNGLPDQFTEVQTQLNNTAGSLASIQTDLNNLSGNINDIKDSITNAKNVMVQYQGIVVSLQDQIHRLQNHFPRWMMVSTWVVTIFLIWLAIAQIGLMLQGIGLIARSEAAELESEEEDRLE